MAAGCLLIAATFLPWTSFYGPHVDGSPPADKAFSGWDLITECAQRTFPSQCVFEDNTLSSELLPDRAPAGDWAIVAGIAIAFVGGWLLTIRTPGRHLTAAITVGWIVSAGAFVCGLVALAMMITTPGGTPLQPSIEFGLVLAAFAPVLALVGMAVVHAAWVRAGAFV